MKSQVDVFLKIMVDMSLIAKDGTWDIKSSYIVKDWKPNAFFDPKKMKEVYYHFHNEFVFKQEDQFYSLPEYKQEDIKANCAKTVEEDFIKNYPKQIKPLSH